MTPIQRKPYQSLAGLTRFLVVAFAAYGVTALAAIVVGVRDLVVRGGWTDPFADGASLEWADGVYAAGALVFLVCGVCFLVWIHRASHNARALGSRGMVHSPGWAVGGFFVPVLNFFRPYQVVTELWRASDPAHPQGGGAWKTEKQPLPSFLSLWWAGWLLGSGLSIGAAYTSSVDAYLAAGAVDLMTLVLAILLVRRLSRRQAMRAEGKSELPGARIL
jgi:hypothetical protein